MPDYSIHLLDVGAVNYGDSILCQFDGAAVLIDGARSSSAQPSQSIVLGEEVRHASIPDQIRSLLNQPTAAVDLLLVTHCHSDHIGCLPDLVAKGSLSTKWALLADPQLGYGIAADSDEPPAFEHMSPADKLRFALREEPFFDATDQEIQDFIDDSAREYGSYVHFVNSLKESLQHRCVIYRGPSEEASPGLTELLSEFSATGLKIYGPSNEHLIRCAGFLAGRSEDALDARLDDNQGDIVEAYRAEIARFEGTDDADSGENGNAVNCQSIVAGFEVNGRKTLLTGDMQFARPQLDDAVKEEMNQLLAAVEEDAPFQFVKLSHHGATNGQNKAILEGFGAKLFAISTGTRSSKHPTEPTLNALSELRAEKSIEWARVDMNGRCTYSTEGAAGKLTGERLQLNDMTLPGDRKGDEAPPEPAVSTGRTASAGTPNVKVESSSRDGIEVTIKLPYRKTKITLTLEVEPQSPL